MSELREVFFAGQRARHPLLRRAANGADTIRGAYATVRNRAKTQKNRKKITLDDYNRKIAQAQELRDKAEAGELTLKEFKALLEKI